MSVETISTLPLTLLFGAVVVTKKLLAVTAFVSIAGTLLFAVRSVILQCGDCLPFVLVVDTEGTRVT